VFHMWINNILRVFRIGIARVTSCLPYRSFFKKQLSLYGFRR